MYDSVSDVHIFLHTHAHSCHICCLCPVGEADSKLQTEITSLKEQLSSKDEVITTTTSDLENVKTQLTEANEKITKLEQVRDATKFMICAILTLRVDWSISTSVKLGKF